MTYLEIGVLVNFTTRQPANLSKCRNVDVGIVKQEQVYAATNTDAILPKLVVCLVLGRENCTFLFGS